ncbi:mitochondrial matrix iron-sulfur protein [Ascosphaera acerosa]|nr:mitochondrial matrix iron-sulfur protein [Ascosphaera acerosa]
MLPDEIERVIGRITEKDVMDFAQKKIWDQDVAVSAVGSIEGLLDLPRIRNDMSRNASLHISFIDKDGEKYDFTVAEGDNLLDIAQANDLEMEGACGGSCACSTCHVIVEDAAMYEKMPEPDDDENDMLDLAFGLTETSRLGCQVKMTRELDGLVVRLPSMTRNLQASDFS